MTLDTVLGIALDLAYFALFGFTLLDYLRHRGPVRRDVMILFAALAFMVGVPALRSAVPTLSPAVGLLVIPAFVAQPLLVLRLVRLVHPLPRWAIPASFVAFAGLTGAFAVLLASGSTTGSAPMAALSLGLLAYFAIGNGAAALWFGRAGQRRAGASRTRLYTAGLATGLLGLAVLLLLMAGFTTVQGSAEAQLVNGIVRIVALGAGVSYLAAFAPPRALRRLSQQAIVYQFIRDLNALPTGSPVSLIWRLLERTAGSASGASRVAMVLEPGGPEPAEGIHRVAIPFKSLRWPDGRLELDLPRHVLFQDDDLELVGLVVDRAIRAAEREQLLEERNELIAELRAASAAKSDFLAAMSHELRTPLNAIIGFSELLVEGRDEPVVPETVATYSEHIHASGLHLLELVNDVLDLARVEAGRLDLKAVEFDLEALVRQTVAGIQPLADQKGQSVTLSLAPATVYADPPRIRQVLLNLLSNAIKFTDVGGTIRIGLEADLAGNVALTVADTGRGIAANDLDRIFEAFQQGGDANSPHHEGTGLGLALSRQLVEAHGGQVEVRSELGVGSEFTVRLPVDSLPYVSDAIPSAEEGQPMVLVIEDDPAARDLLRVHLEGAGYAVLGAATGRQGLAWVRQAKPDAVLLDIRLPDIDGWEILRRLKADPATRAIPVMVVSVVDNRELGMALGAVDYFVKPIARDPLLEALGRLTFTTKVRSRSVTVLVIDADPEAPQRYRHLLEPDGFEIITSADGAGGRRRAIEDRPDLIILDSQLPDIDGFELTAALRNDPQTAAIPVWMTTPAGLQPEARERLNDNVQGVLARGDDAIVAMHAWLTRKGAPA